jgi:glycerate 2-kinase
MADYLLESFNIWGALLQKIDPSKLIPESISVKKSGELMIGNDVVPIPAGNKLYVIGTGKASAGMALGMEQVLGSRLADGMIITTPGYRHRPKRIKILTGSHPYPDQHSFRATEELLSFVRHLPANSTLINLISGGTSSLLCRPAAGIPENDITRLYKQLVTSGADIKQINSVRKAVSAVKGGRLLAEMPQLHLIDLLISDVPDDDPEDIGSGPTTAQSVSAVKAKTVLEQAGLWNRIPESVRTHILHEAGNELNTGEPVTRDIKQHRQFILSSATMVAGEARKLLESRGFIVSSETAPWSGPIDEFESTIQQTMEKMLQSGSFPAAHVFYGECTVQVSGSGKGGRNQELALRMAKRLNGLNRKVLFLSAGTDGIDGPTDAAGAVVDETTWQDGYLRGVDPEKALAENDSYTFFNDTRWHIKTGSTGNNVMDIQILHIP